MPCRSLSTMASCRRGWNQNGTDARRSALLRVMLITEGPPRAMTSIQGDRIHPDPEGTAAFSGAADRGRLLRGADQL